MAGVTRFLEVQLQGLKPSEFDAPAFYKARLQGTDTVQVARVEEGSGGTTLLLSGAAKEVAKLWRGWGERTKIVHAGSTCHLWAPKAPLKAPPRALSRKKRSEPLAKPLAVACP